MYDNMKLASPLGLGQEAVPRVSQACRPLGFWLFAATILNLFLAGGNGFGSDIQYWVDWTRHMQLVGYANFGGNYPPAYIHWLWLVGRLYDLLGIMPANDILLRFLANTPVWLCHLAMMGVMARLMSRRHVGDGEWNGLMALAALNPAILIDGPIWGQVDIIFSLWIGLALLWLIRGHYLLLVAPMLTLALLTKFQTICIAPVLLPLVWTHRRSQRLWAGLLLVVPVALLILMPYLRAGSFDLMLEQAYLQASSMYPVATLNATNFWYLLGLNDVHHSRFLFDIARDAKGAEKLFTAQYGGLVLFALWSLWLTVDGFLHNRPERHWRNAMLSTVGFFLFLPAMHERYMFPAVVIALIAAAAYSRFILHALVITVLITGHLLFVMAPGIGPHTPYVLSVLTLLLAVGMAVRGTPDGLLRTRWFNQHLGIWLVVCVTAWAGMLAFHLDVAVEQRERLSGSMGWIDATLVPGRHHRQSWGDLRINANVGNRPLLVGNQAFSSGFGTHAPSTIDIPVPRSARTFTAQVGVDAGAPQGEIAFEVRVDGVNVWRSPPVRGEEGRLFNVEVDVRGKGRVELVAHELDSMTADHANWLNPRFLTQPLATAGAQTATGTTRDEP
ncbi:MAG: NPCBM/NEW2 domain-containing protein [Moraxellaceae bacterium]|nr:NPCBM/NEW2 domain-containing protein [Moraxellaceae bacterium]